MLASGILLDYNGQVDIKVIEVLLKKLRKNDEFLSLNKITYKRVYSIVVECLENICKNTPASSVNDLYSNSHISVRIENKKIYIKAVNPVSDTTRESLSEKIDFINSLSYAELKTLYENKINTDTSTGENGGGLGFIFMVLKSENKLEYGFQPLTEGYLYFELKIKLNKYIMRKLIIEKTSSTPKVILDPENKIFRISGESRPPDVREFYGQIISWLQEFGSYLVNETTDKDPVVFNLFFEYFNSSSGKFILDMCKILAGLRSKGINLSVIWHYEREDGDMLEVGKEMSRIVKFPFEYVESETD